MEIRSTDIEEILKFDNHDRYGFYKCESCGGPMLGHMEVKCRALNGVMYDMVTNKIFKDWLERIPEFRVAVNQRERKREVNNAESQAEKLGEVVMAIMEGIQPQNGQTTQLVKLRWPTTWSEQSFEKWRKEVERWAENNTATEEDKFVDLLESLKKKEMVKDYVTKTLVEKIGETREVKKVLGVIAEKYSKIMCERIMEVMEKISGFKENIS